MPESIRAGRLEVPVVADLRPITRQMRRDLQQRTVQAGTRAGRVAGDAYVRSMEQQYRLRMADARESMARGLISPEQFRRAGKQAGVRFNQGILAEIKRLANSGQLTQQKFLMLSGQLKNSRGELDAMGRSSQTLIGRLRAIGTAARAFIIGALVVGLYAARRAFTALTKTQSEFDQAMTRSLAIMGDLSQAMEDTMGRRARQLARRFNIDADKIAEGYFYLASAGLNAAQAIGALPQVTAFAKAGAFDLAEATDLLTDAQSALGLTVEDTAENMRNMGRVGDVLVKANTLANATVEQFSKSLTNQAGAAMKAWNIEVEEGVAVLAALADQGVKAEEAGTGFSRFLRLINQAVARNREEMAAMNLEFLDARGNLLPIADIIEQLTDRFGNMSDAQRATALQSIGFTARVQQMILPLLGTSDAIRQYETGLKDAGGTMNDIANRQMQSFQERMGQVNQQWEEVRRTIGRVIGLPVAEFFAGIADAIINVESPLENLIERLEEAGVAAELVAPTIIRQQIAETEEQVRSYREELEKLRGRPIMGLPGGRMEVQFDVGLEALRAQRRELQALRDEALASSDAMSDVYADAYQDAIDRLDEQIAMEVALADAIQMVADAETALVEARERAGLRRRAEEIEREIDALEERMAREGESVFLNQRYNELLAEREELRKQIEGEKPEREPPGGLPVDTELLERRESMLLDLQDRIFELTATTRDMQERELDKLEASFRETFGDRLPQEVADGLQRLRDRIEQDTILEGFREQFESIASGPQTEGQMTALQGLMDRMSEQMEMLPEGSTLYEEYAETIEKVAEAMRELAEAVRDEAEAQEEANEKTEEAARKERLRGLRDTARTIEENARAALNLADAMGAIEEETRRALEAMITFGTSMVRVLGGDLSALPAAIASAANMVGQAFGDSERDQALQENSARIRELTEGIGKLSDQLSGISGSAIAGVESALEAEIAAFEARHASPLWNIMALDEGNLQRELAELGLSMEDLQEVAKTLGISYDGTRESAMQLLEAIRAIDLARLFETLAGQLELLRAEFELFDIEDPIEQLQRMLALFLEFTDLDDTVVGGTLNAWQRAMEGLPLYFQEAFSGIDVTTAEGRAEMESLLQELFRMLQSGELTPDELGMSVDEFLRFLTDMEGLLDEIEEGGVVGGAAETRMAVNITTEQGSTMISYLGTAVFHLRGIHGILAGGTIPTPTAVQTMTAAPSGSMAGATGGGMNVTINGITVTIPIRAEGVVGEAELREAGRTAGEAMGDSFARRLGRIHRGQGGLGRPVVPVEKGGAR